MPISELEQWFSGPQLDLSFTFQSVILTPKLSFFIDRGFERSSITNESCNEKECRQEGSTHEAAQSSQGPRRNTEHRDGGQAAGSVIYPDIVPTMLVSKIQAMSIDTEPRKPIRKPLKVPEGANTLMTIAEVETTSNNTSTAYTKYTSHTIQGHHLLKPTPEGLSRMSSVSTVLSTTSIDTTLDYSFFAFLPVEPEYPVSKHHEIQNDIYFEPGDPDIDLGSRNLQSQPGQLARRSARHYTHRTKPPGRTSLAMAQKSHRSSSRGPARQKPKKNVQYLSPGGPRIIGNMKNIPVYSTGAQKIKVVRSGKPLIISVSTTPSSQRPSKNKLVPLSPRLLFSRPPTPPPKSDLARTGYTLWPRIQSSATTFHKKQPELRSTSTPLSAVEILSAQQPLRVQEGRGVTTAQMEVMPDVLKIGNKRNSSLFNRLASLDALDVRSRY